MDRDGLTVQIAVDAASPCLAIARAHLKSAIGALTELSPSHRLLSEAQEIMSLIDTARFHAQNAVECAESAEPAPSS